MIIQREPMHYFIFYGFIRRTQINSYAEERYVTQDVSYILLSIQTRQKKVTQNYGQNSTFDKAKISNLTTRQPTNEAENRKSNFRIWRKLKFSSHWHSAAEKYY